MQLDDDLDDLDPSATLASVVAERAPYEPLRSIHELQIEHESRLTGMLRQVYEDATGRISTDTTPTLLDRLERAEEVAVAWQIQCELTRRRIPPVLRTRAPQDTKQHRFCTMASDLFWLATVHPGHKTATPRTRGLFTLTPGDANWHALAVNTHKFGKGEHFRIALELGLTDAMRYQLATMATQEQSAQRRAVTKATDRIREQLTARALKHPDKSGKVEPEDVVRRQMQIIWYFVRCHCNSSLTADLITKTTTRAIKRWTVAHTIADIKKRGGKAENVMNKCSSS